MREAPQKPRIGAGRSPDLLRNPLDAKVDRDRAGAEPSTSFSLLSEALTEIADAGANPLTRVSLSRHERTRNPTAPQSILPVRRRLLLEGYLNSSTEQFNMLVDHRRFKDELYKDLARIGAALSSPKRLEMLDILAQRERSVEDLARELGLSVANASKHLNILAAAHLVEVRRAGTFAFYRLAGATALRVLRLVGELGEEMLPEVKATLHRHLGERSVQALEPGAVARRIKRGAVLLDVRPEAEYRAGHIAGARSVPIDALKRKKNMPPLPRGREIIVYCRGPHCVWADEAVDVLRRRGYTAQRLLLGAPDWLALGGELESAS